MDSAHASAAQRFTRWHPRFALCAVCRRPAQGFGWQEPRGARQPRPSVWFCSISCQRFFSMRAWRSSAMVDLTEQEKAAIRTTVKLIAEIMEEIGWRAGGHEKGGPDHRRAAQSAGLCDWPIR
jgi:hypothetical protein